MPYISNLEEFFQNHHEDATSRDHQTEIDAIACSIVNKALKIRPGERNLIRFDENAAPLVKCLYRKCEEMGAPTGLFLVELPLDVKRALGMKNPSQIPQLFEEQKELADSADRIIFIKSPYNPKELDKLPYDKKEAYDAAYRDAFGKLNTGQARWMRLDWPTHFEARQEGLSYDQYFLEFLRACNQDWSKIHDAQQRVIEVLDKGSDLQFIVNNPNPLKRTNVAMSVAGFTFANSTIGQNYPGSEVFSAPALESVQGQIFAPDRFMHQGKIIQGIHLNIRDGKVLENSYAQRGNKALQALLSASAAMRYFGEVAFGTNPGIYRQFFNAVLLEKRAGTVHMALGKCIEETTYSTLKDTQSLFVNNGNTFDLAPYHFDIVIPMLRCGIVNLDGKTIQINGRFLDEKLSALNPT